MNYYFTAISLIAGICLGFGILYLFIGLRRRDNKPLNLFFVIFALCYAITLLNGIRWYSATNVSDFIAINRFDSIFVTGAFVGLIWFISYYTGFHPHVFLWILSAAFIVPAVVYLLSPATFTGDVSGLVYIILPWGEKLADLDATGSIWLDLQLLARLVSLIFISTALVRQFLKGQRQSAIILGLGMIPFIGGIFYEILGESGYVPYIPLGELGFLGIAIAASLEMANSIIKTEQALEEYRQNLEQLVEERTTELEATQEQLISQTKEKAMIDERNRLARDLHDAVTQTIYSASLIAEVLPSIWERNPEEGQRNLYKLRQLVRGALAEMRSLLFELRPASMEKASLDTLIQFVADAFTGRTRVPVTLEVAGFDELPANVKITYYRISQEVFNNISKHAEATSVEVNLKMGNNAVALGIMDNGIGFDTKRNTKPGMGLSILGERAAEIGAQLEIESRLGYGTQVFLSWAEPVEE